MARFTPINPLFEPSLTLIGGIGIAGAAVAVIVAIIFAILVLVMKRGNKAMIDISKAIAHAAFSFILFEYLALTVFMLILFVIVSAVINWQTGICFLVGTFCSAFAGAVGLFMSQANVRTTQASDRSMLYALRTAFTAGAVMGLFVVAVGLGGICFFLMVFGVKSIVATPYLAGFGLGCTVVSLFSRIGGGIFTKAADVGADLVGKVEKNLPEDDIRNPATVADLVGDNVGDIIGTGADLTGSLVGSLVAAAILGYQDWGPRGVGYPIWIVTFGIISSLVGQLSVWTRHNATRAEILLALRFGLLMSSAVQMGFIALCTFLLSMPWQFFGIGVIGVACGFLVAACSEIFTSASFFPTISVAKAGKFGAATVVVQGLAQGFYSIGPATVFICATLIGSIIMGGVYGASIAAVALLSNLAFILAMDVQGAVADNAGGIAEMAHLPQRVRDRTDALDSVGNTTAATGKAFALGAALLTGFALINIFKTLAGIELWDAASDPFAVGGLLVGVTLPFLLSAMLMQAVNSCAESVIIEVRRQFRVNPEILTGQKKANHSRLVVQVTAASIHAMIFPATVTIIIPLVIGIFFPLQFLLAFLLGYTMTGFCLATFLANAGGCWDNAKKYVETGKFGGKNSSTHKACISADTIGDSCKDTAAPGVSIGIKLTNYISIVLVPIFLKSREWWWVGFIILAVAAFLLIPIMLASPQRLIWLYCKLTKKNVEDFSFGSFGEESGEDEESASIVISRKPQEAHEQTRVQI